MALIEFLGIREIGRMGEIMSLLVSVRFVKFPCWREYKMESFA